MESRFLCDFQADYLRVMNHGRKVIRCFPKCSDEGHRSYGFCGTHISASIWMPSHIPIEQLRFWGHISVEKSIKNPKVNDDLPLNAFQIKTNECPAEDWVMGKVTNTIEDSKPGFYQAEIKFNADMKSWMYSWRSHRYSSNLGHCFQFYACILNPDSLSIHHVFKSSVFGVHSRAIKPAASPPLFDAPRTKRKEAIPTQICKRQVAVGYQPTEPTTPEYIENRTLDRMHDLVESGLNFERFRATLVADGLESGIADGLQRIVDRYMTLLRCTSSVNSMISRLANHPEYFKELCCEELQFYQHSQYDATMVDADYVEGHSAASVFGKLRQSYRDNLRVVLSLEDTPIHSMIEAMTCASLAGLIPLDPCHPPSTTVASCIRDRLYGKSYSFNPTTYSTGLSKFSSETSFLAYARDLMQFRRLSHHSIALARIQSIQREDTSDNTSSYISGRWVNEALGTNSDAMKVPGLHGHLLGAFGSQLTMKIYSNVEVIFDGSRLIAKTSESLAQMDILLDALSHAFVPGIVIGSFESPFGRDALRHKSRYLAYQDESEDNLETCVICRDFGKILCATFVREKYPEMFARHPASSYQGFLFMQYQVDKSNPDILTIRLDDFLIPHLEPFEFERESLGILHKGIKFLACSNEVIYIRSMNYNKEAELLSLISPNVY